MQTHNPAHDAKKTCRRRPSRERLKGFEPSTFCMASRTLASRSTLNDPAKKPFSAAPAARRKARHSPGNHGGFRTETGPSLAPPSPRESHKSGRGRTNKTAKMLLSVGVQAPQAVLSPVVRSDGGAKLRGTAASAPKAGAAGVPVEAPSPRHITGRVLRDTRSRGRRERRAYAGGVPARGSLPYAASAWRGGQPALGVV
jgi:hypothetical protein